MAWWQLPVVAVAVVALDRLALAAETRGWLYWRRSQGGGSGGGSGALGELIEVFQPSRSSTVAETERRRLDIVQRGVEGPPFGVDLDAGVAYVPRSVDGVSRPDYRASMGLVVSNLSVDCAEPRALASWWAEALGWQVIEDPDLEDGADDEVGIEPTDRSAPGLLFLRVPEPKSLKNRLHLDVRPPNGSDQLTELARLLAMGARRADVGQGADVPWVVLADPEGNEFCLLRGEAAE